jgi:hypothetical protein
MPLFLTSWKEIANQMPPDIARRGDISKSSLTFSLECLASPHIAIVRLASSPTYLSIGYKRQKVCPRDRSTCL